MELFEHDLRRLYVLWCSQFRVSLSRGRRGSLSLEPRSQEIVSIFRSNIPLIVSLSHQSMSQFVPSVLLEVTTKGLDQPHPLNPQSKTFIISNEGHTLGNAIRHTLLQNPSVDFAGYSVPHPSEPKMHIRVQTKKTKNGDELSADQAIIEACTSMNQMLDIVRGKVLESTQYCPEQAKEMREQQNPQNPGLEEEDEEEEEEEDGDSDKMDDKFLV